MSISVATVLDGVDFRRYSILMNETNTETELLANVVDLSQPGDLPAPEVPDDGGIVWG